MQIKEISINQSINSKSRVTGLLLKRSKRGYRLHGNAFLYKHSTQPYTIWGKSKYKRQGQNAGNNKSIQDRKTRANRSLERRATPKEYKGTSEVIEVKKGWYNFVLKEPLKRWRR